MSEEIEGQEFMMWRSIVFGLALSIPVWVAAAVAWWWVN